MNAYSLLFSAALAASPRANMTCATYPREISERRGRYDDQPAVEGPDARSEGSPRSGPPPIPPGSDSEVVPRARRRRFSNAGKRRILRAAAQTPPRGVGRLLVRPLVARQVAVSADSMACREAG